MGNSATTVSDSYDSILKDAKKIRIDDQKNNYNAHRQKDSISANLPSDLKTYSNVVHSVNEFWLDNIVPLTFTGLNDLAALLSSHLYLNCRESRIMLLSANMDKNKKQIIRIPSHSVKIFTVFEYVIRNIITPSNHAKLFQQLQSLGALHASCSITNEMYEALLKAFNYAIEEKFNKLFTLRIRFCFSQLFRVIIDIMTQNDFISLLQRKTQMNSNTSNTLSVSQTRSIRSTSKFGLQNTPSPYTPFPVVKASQDYNLDISPSTNSTFYQQIDGFIISLEDCLSDEHGLIYFKKYCEELFCVENFLFHEHVTKYRTSTSSQRKKLGTFIIDTFIKVGAEKQVNIGSSTRKEIEAIINLTKKLNNDKEKYEKILLSTTANHQRKDTAGLLIHLTDNPNFVIDDMVYSFGFTKKLFDRAYDEIFNLMRTNLWSGFRNKILGYCDDKEFLKEQNEKLNRKKEEQREQRKIITVIKLKKQQKRKRRTFISPLLTINDGSVIFHRDLEDEKDAHSDIEIDLDIIEDDVHAPLEAPVMLDKSTTSMYDISHMLNMTVEKNLQNISRIKKSHSQISVSSEASISPKSLEVPISLLKSTTSDLKIPIPVKLTLN